MKTTILFISIILISCESTSSQFQNKSDTENHLVIQKDSDETLNHIIPKTDQSNFGNINNPLFGKTFRVPSELPGINYNGHASGSLIMGDKIRRDKEFGISHIKIKNKNIIIFEELIRNINEPKLKYLTLDTINIDTTDDNDYISYCKCRQDSISDEEIIALIETENNAEYYYKIKKAWRADTKTGKIIEIKNTNGINCVNESYGADGCGEDE